MATDFTKSAQQILVDLINESNSTALTVNDITFGAPSVQASGNRNTGITIIAVPNSGYTGTRDLTYDRVDLAQVPGSRSVNFAKGSSATAMDLVPAINAAFGINLTADDVYDDALPAFSGDIPDEIQPFILRAKEGSLVFRGQVSLNIAGNDIDLATIVTVTELNGLTYPIY